MRKLLIVLISLILVIGISYLIYYYFVIRDKGNDQVSLPTQNTDTTTQVDASKIVFESNFDDADQAEKWEIFDDADAVEKPSHWFIEDGVLKQDSNIWAGTFGAPVNNKSYLGSQIIIKDGQKWKNYKVTFRFKPLDNDGVGFLVHYKNQDNYLRFMTVLDSTQDNGGPFLKIDKRVKGVTSGLYVKKISYKVGEWNSATVVANGPKVIFFFNDNKSKSLVYGVDKSLTAGRFGFSVFAEEGVEFDDVVISQL